MADVKQETLKPDIADGIYVKFQRNPHMFASNNIVGRIIAQDVVRVSEKSKMAA